MRTPFRVFTLRTALRVAVFLVAPESFAQALVYIWSGSGSWPVTSRWTPAAVPGASDTAQIDGGTANVDDARTVGVLLLGGGTLGGGGTLSLAGTGSIWTSGPLVGTGTLKLLAGATLEIAGATNKSFYRGDGYGTSGRTIENLGTIKWTGTGSLLGGDGAQIVNQSGGVFDLQSDSTLGYTGGGSGPAFTNAGTFRKSAGTGTSVVSQTGFTNSGVVEVLTGNLSFTSGVTSHGGTFSAAAGTSMIFSGGQTFNTGSTFSGAGTIRIDGGTTTVSGSLSSNGLILAGGTLQGSAAVSGTLSWTGGVWSGTGTLTLNSGGTLGISGSADKAYNRADGYGTGGRIIENFGTTIWTGTGNLLGGDGGQIINRSGGVFLVQNDATLGYTNGGSGPTITNQGTFRKNTATGTTSVSGGSFVNSGVVDAQSGTISFASGVTSNGGSFAAATGANIVFSGGQTFNHGTSFSSPAGNIRIAGGATTISGNLTASGLLFAGGDLYGSGTIGGSLEWTAGTWRTAQVVTFSANSTLTLSGAASKVLLRGDGYGTGGRTLRTGGTLVWVDAGQIVGHDGAGIDVVAGGLFEVRNDSTFRYGGGGSIPFLTNAGTVKKLASTGTTTLEGVAFTNTGTLQILGGTLALTQGGGLANNGLVEVQGGALTSSASGMTSSGGTFTLSSGAQLRYTGGTNTVLNSAFNGAGLTEVAGGTLHVSGSTIGGNFQLSSGTIGGSGTFTVNTGGTFSWTGGDLIHTGTLAVATGGSLQISGSDPKKFYRGDGYGTGGRVITNAGTTTWTGTGSVLGGDGASFANLAGGVFDAKSDATFGYTNGGNGPTFSNAGTVRKSAGSGVSALALPLYNSGTAESQTGTLRLAGGGSASGQFLANGGTIDFASSYTLNDGARLLGTTSSKLTAGSLGIPSLATATLGGTGIGRFSFEGGSLDGAGDFVIGQLGEAIWSGGNLIGTGVLRIAVGGSLQVSGAINHDFYRGDGYGTGGRTIENLGTLTWSEGNIRGGDGARYVNATGSLFEITGSGTFGYTGGGNGPSFTNAGTVRKSAGATTTFSQTGITTSGAVEVNAGSLVFASGVTSNAGSFSAAAGTTLTFSGGQTFNTGTSFSGAGLIQATAGATTISGTINSANFVFAGGSLYGTGTVTGNLTWTGGDMRSASTLGIAAGATLLVSGTGDRSFFRGDGYGSGGRVIENFGSFIVTNAGNLLGGDGAHIVNRTGGVLDFRNDRTLGYTGGGNGPSLINEGTLRKTVGTGTTTISSTGVSQNGLVEVASGTLLFASGVTSNAGHFNVASGATLEFAGGQTFNTGTQISGPGLTRITGGSTSLSGSVTFANLEFAAGSLWGTGTLAAGTMKWTGGDLRGANTLTVGPGAALVVGGIGDRAWLRGDGYGSGGRVIENQGTLTIENTGNFLGYDGAQLINRAGATVNLRNDATMAYGGGGNGPWFTNEGTLLKSAGTGTSTIAIPFYNTGQITVTSGTLAFTSTFSSTNGGITLANGASVSTSGPLDLGTGPLTGSGTLTASTVTARALVSPGSSPGRLNITGNLTLASTSRLIIELGGTAQGVSYDFLNVSGTAQLGGELRVNFTNGFQAGVPVGTQFVVLTAGTLANTTTFSFSNVAPGQRLLTTDGAGSFQVDYGSASSYSALTNSVVLSNFIAVPEPCTYALFGLGTAVVFASWRRRRQ